MTQKNVLLDNEYSEIELENGVIIIKWKSSFVDIHTAKQIVNSRLEATAGQTYPVLLKIKSVRNSTKEARDFFASKEGAKNIIAMAIYVDSMLANMIATLFMYLNTPSIPVKLFKDETKAKEWLVNYTANKI